MTSLSTSMQPPLNLKYIDCINGMDKQEELYINKKPGCWSAADRAAAYYLVIDLITSVNFSIARNYFKTSIERNVWSSASKDKLACKYKMRLDEKFLSVVSSIKISDEKKENKI